METASSSSPIASSSKIYDLIDVAKFVLSFAVVAIHTELLHGLAPLPKWLISSFLFRLAVPFFMITSGFFLGLKVRKNGTSHFKKYRQKLLSVFLLYATIGMILNAVVLYHNSHNIADTVIKSIQSFVFYPKGAMWFILALIVGSYILEFLLNRKWHSVTIFVVSFVLYCFSLLCNNYYFLAESTILAPVISYYMRIFISSRNGLFLLLYIVMGYMMSSAKILNLPTKIVVLCIIIGFFSLACETVFLYGKSHLDDCSLFLSHLTAIPSMILLLTKSHAKIKCHVRLRNISTVIYYTHPVFSIILGTYLGFPDGIIRFIFVSALSLIVWYVTKGFDNAFITSFFR